MVLFVSIIMIMNNNLIIRTSPYGNFVNNRVGYFTTINNLVVPKSMICCLSIVPASYHGQISVLRSQSHGLQFYTSKLLKHNPWNKKNSNSFKLETIFNIHNVWTGPCQVNLVSFSDMFKKTSIIFVKNEHKSESY